MGLSPGPRDQVLGSRATSGLEDWGPTFRSAARNMDIGAHRLAREQVMEGFGQAPLSEAEKPAAAPQAATPPEPATRNPERGELWAAYTGYNFNRFARDEGYGLVWNYPSMKEAVAAARSQCERVQPPPPSFGHDRCGDRTSAISTTATYEIISGEAQLGRPIGNKVIIVRNPRCLAVFKEVDSLANVYIGVVFGNTEEEAAKWAEKSFKRYWSQHEILKVVCNDW